MKCEWRDDEECLNEATEKWTDIPYIDPYTGLFYSNDEEAARDIVVTHQCAEHCNLSRSIFLETCKGDSVKANELLNRCYKIEKL